MQDTVEVIKKITAIFTRLINHNASEVVINPNSKTCTSLNPHGERPDRSKMQGLKYACEIIKWSNAESKRKKYEIVCLSPYDCQKSIICECKAKYKEGTIHKAQIIKNKAVIL